MKNKAKEHSKFSIQGPLNGKRDYYFHADEDFREDREWGKTKPVDAGKRNSLAHRSTLNA